MGYPKKLPGQSLEIFQTEQNNFFEDLSVVDSHSGQGMTPQRPFQL